MIKWKVYKEFFIGDSEGGESYLLLSTILFLITLPRLVRWLRTFHFIILGQMISDQNLLKDCSDIIFEHRILVRPPK